MGRKSTIIGLFLIYLLMLILFKDVLSGELIRHHGDFVFTVHYVNFDIFSDLITNQDIFSWAFYSNGGTLKFSIHHASNPFVVLSYIIFYALVNLFNIELVSFYPIIILTYLSLYYVFICLPFYKIVKEVSSSDFLGVLGATLVSFGSHFNAQIYFGAYTFFGIMLFSLFVIKSLKEPSVRFFLCLILSFFFMISFHLGTLNILINILIIAFIISVVFLIVNGKLKNSVLFLKKVRSAVVKRAIFAMVLPGLLVSHIIYGVFIIHKFESARRSTVKNFATEVNLNSRSVDIIDHINSFASPLLKVKSSYYKFGLFDGYLTLLMLFISAVLSFKYSILRWSLVFFTLISLLGVNDNSGYNFVQKIVLLLNPVVSHGTRFFSITTVYSGFVYIFIICLVLSKAFKNYKKILIVISFVLILERIYFFKKYNQPYLFTDNTLSSEEMRKIYPFPFHHGIRNEYVSSKEYFVNFGGNKSSFPSKLFNIFKVPSLSKSSHLELKGGSLIDEKGNEPKYIFMTKHSQEAAVKYHVESESIKFENKKGDYNVYSFELHENLKFYSFSPWNDNIRIYVNDKILNNKTGHFVSGAYEYAQSVYDRKKIFFSASLDDSVKIIKIIIEDPIPFTVSNFNPEQIDLKIISRENDTLVINRRFGSDWNYLGPKRLNVSGIYQEIPIKSRNIVFKFNYQNKMGKIVTFVRYLAQFLAGLVLFMEVFFEKRNRFSWWKRDEIVPFDNKS